MITRQNPAAIRALAILLLLVQLPHWLHLPPWVSALGITIVGLRLLAEARPGNRLLGRLLSPLMITLIAVAAAVLIRWHYGYLIGRDPCVAFLYLLVAAKFGEYRRPADATLLLCLAAFLLLTQYFYAQTILSALVTLPAVLALGNALAVLRDPAASRGTAANLKLIARLLLQGAPLAALLFLVFPRLPGPLWSLPEDGAGRTGLSDSMAPGSISALTLSDEVAFRVDFDDAVPAPSERYWRGPVLSDFDGRRWSVAPPMAGTSRLPDGGTAVAYTVMLQPHQRRWLFALDQASSVPADGTGSGGQPRPLARMSHDRQLLTVDPVIQVLRYRQQSTLLDRYRPARPPRARSLALPQNNPASLAFARSLFAESGNRPTAYVDAVLQHFNRQPFYYSLTPALLGDDAVDDFLFGTRNGFCEHYASAFVVLMRAAGIPARVVTGYLGGQMNGDYMIVRQSDAHAWTEVFIDQHWRRIDPTASIAPSRVDASLGAVGNGGAEALHAGGTAAAWMTRLRLGWDALNHDWQRLVVDFDNDSQSRLLERLGLASPALWQITLAVLLAAGCWVAIMMAWPIHRRRRASPEDAAWQRLCHLLARHGVQREPAEAPERYLQRAALQLPTQEHRIYAIGATLGALRFERLNDDERQRRLQVIDEQYRPLQRSLWWRRWRRT